MISLTHFAICCTGSTLKSDSSHINFCSVVHFTSLCNEEGDSLIYSCNVLLLIYVMISNLFSNLSIVKYAIVANVTCRAHKIFSVHQTKFKTTYTKILDTKNTCTIIIDNNIIV